MLLESVEEYSADATRFALADAGDRYVRTLQKYFQQNKAYCSILHGLNSFICRLDGIPFTLQLSHFYLFVLHNQPNKHFYPSPFFHFFIFPSLHLPFSPSLHLPFTPFSPSLLLSISISRIHSISLSLHLSIFPSLYLSFSPSPIFYLLLLSFSPSSYTNSPYLSMEDANFDRSVANQAVTYLHNEEEWARLVLADDAAGENIHHPITTHLLTIRE